MEIGLVIKQFDPHWGGAERWMFQHASQLVDLGHGVHVITGRVGEGARDLGCTFHLFAQQRSCLARASAAEKILKKLSLDVVHDVGMGWCCDILQSEDGSRLAQWEQILKTLPGFCRPLKRAMIRTLPRYRDFRTQMTRQYGDHRRLFVAVSEMCARDYQQHHGVDPARIRLVYHGADIERFAPCHRLHHRQPVRARWGIRDEEVVFLFVGHDYRRKGLSTAIRAISRLAAGGLPVRLLVVGGRRRACSREHTHPPFGTVIFTGCQPDPVPFYAAADVFVLPTFYDPCSLSVGEAAASGLPVVTTRCNGASELLAEGRDAFILEDPADDLALADCLRNLMDVRVREWMGAAARQRVLRYPLERNCTELLSIYREVAERRAGESSSSPCLQRC